jgi:hypothetical protein
MANVNFPSANAQKVSNLWVTDQALTDEGSYFTACSPTPLTGITGTASLVADGAAGAQVNPFLLITNGNPVAGPTSKTIYLKYLKIKCTGATFTSATDYCYTIRVDALTAKYTSGGSAITPQNVNTAFPNNSGAIIHAGALVTLASDPTTGRLLYSGLIEGAIPVAKNVWTFTFGDNSMPTNQLGATGLKWVTVPCGPMGLAPGWNLQLDLFGTANAGTFAAEFEMGYAERVSGQ